MSGGSRPPLRLCLTTATTLYKLNRNASNIRNTTAKAIRKIHAPAYCPVVFGVKADDQRGVLVEVKNAMIMDSMFIVMLDDCMSIGLAVEEGMAVAEVAPIGMSIDGDAESMMVIVVLSRRVPRYDEGEQKLVE
ncbi:hypothetical protein Trihar35433_9319 [Trichoderma harzianum]|nr:hypothetical protein Trihar35433_9319 [Trichoderma harzianum]